MGDRWLRNAIRPDQRFRHLFQQGQLVEGAGRSNPAGEEAAAFFGRSRLGQRNHLGQGEGPDRLRRS
jgi:hypothetical protein